MKKKDDRITVSKYIRGIIVGQAASHDIDMKELAALLGISQNTMTKYTKDPMCMTVEQLYRALTLLDCKFEIETQRPM